MVEVGTEVLYFRAAVDNPVTHHVDVDTPFRVRTQINLGPWIRRLSSAERTYWKKRLKGGNPSSGCVFVDGVQPGDLLAVDIGAFTVDPVGYTCFGGSNGASPTDVHVEPGERLVDICNGSIYWSPSLRLPLRPMLGFVGAAPAAGQEAPHNGWAGTWGGNLDAQELTTGTTLYLPVHHAGARLHIGDMHACQGDGEICGAGGIECGGTVVLTCRRTAARPAWMRWPRFETEHHIGVLAADADARRAFQAALGDLIRWIDERYGVPAGAAYLLLGQVLEARVTQFVNPTATYVVKVAKRFLEECGHEHGPAQHRR